MAFSIIGPKDFLLSVHSVIEHNAHQAVNQNTKGSKIVSLKLLQYRLWFFQIFVEKVENRVRKYDDYLMTA